MTDRELLELAAKAAGKSGHWDGYVFVLDSYGQDECSAWWPLDNDGDALRLAVKLGLELDFEHGSCTAALGSRYRETYRHEFQAGEPMERARRVIVRVAAEIGKEMP